MFRGTVRGHEIVAMRPGRVLAGFRTGMLRGVEIRMRDTCGFAFARPLGVMHYRHFHRLSNK